MALCIKMSERQSLLYMCTCHHTFNFPNAVLEAEGKVVYFIVWVLKGQKIRENLTNDVTDRNKHPDCRRESEHQDDILDNNLLQSHISTNILWIHRPAFSRRSRDVLGLCFTLGKRTLVNCCL